MDAPLIITIALMVFFAAIFAGLWARRPGIRPVLGGLGLVLIPLGFWLFGLTNLMYNGILSIIDWAQQTVWNTTMTWGVSLAAGGLLIFMISRFIKPAQRKAVTRSEAPAVAPATQAAPPLRRAGAKAVPDSSAGQQSAVPAEKKTSEDSEVEDILRKRGLL
ncbi:MAG: hypothetical protein ACTHWA_10285 [Arachnia sp.]